MNFINNPFIKHGTYIIILHKLLKGMHIPYIKKKVQMNKNEAKEKMTTKNTKSREISCRLNKLIAAYKRFPNKAIQTINTKDNNTTEPVPFYQPVGKQS